ncbi:MAG: ABC transporter ATP-binding protein, partial [Deltaproteobacteria bacterium]|nr:ABC transporter ATP-binding protein [Deltaproteobacteria bacterium]
ATNDLNAIRMAMGMALVALVDGVILSLMAIGFMVHISFWLTVYALIPAPFLVFITNRLSKLVHDKFLRVQETFSQLTEGVRENFAGIRVVKSYVQENHRLERINEVSSQLVQRNMELTKVWGVFFPMILGLINLSLAIVLVFGGRQTILHTITPGDFVAFISYLGILTWPLIALGWVMNIFQRGAASMKRVNDLLETRPEHTDSSHPVRIVRLSGKIELRDLSFSYAGRSPVLKNITLTINPGETVAIVGRIGSGKTTLLNLLFRLYEVNEGSIFLDGHDVQTIPLEKLRQNIGYVPQDTFLFSDTIRENISFGSPHSSRGKIVEVTRIAQVHDEIMSFPHQFETVIGEKGVILSGGQKQRIAIARALLIDTPILILDNALSSVDIHTEELIMANLKPLISGKTSIIVTHRISSIRDVDRIYVLDEGEIREKGDHETLLTLGGRYAEMFRRQQIEKELEKNAT